MIDVSHIAKLARLGLTAREKYQIKKELAAILAFVEKLEEVKVDKVEPTSQVTGLTNVSRPDKARVKTEIETRKLLDLAPETENRHLKVKAIL